MPAEHRHPANPFIFTSVGTENLICLSLQTFSEADIDHSPSDILRYMYHLKPLVIHDPRRF